MKFLCFHLEDGIFIIFHATFSLYVLLESLRDAIPSSWVRIFSGGQMKISQEEKNILKTDLFTFIYAKCTMWMPHHIKLKEIKWNMQKYVKGI